MLADLRLYAWLLVEHWAAFMTGGVPAAIFLILERFRKKQFEWKTFFFVFIVFGFFAASYQTWHDQYKQQTQKSALRSQHVTELQKFWIEGGELLKDEVTKDDFDKWIDKANSWVGSTSKWIGDNMGAPARERFLDTAGMMGMSYSRAINSQHNTAIQNITRFRDNLRDLVNNEAWDCG